MTSKSKGMNEEPRDSQYWDERAEEARARADQALALALSMRLIPHAESSRKKGTAQPKNLRRKKTGKP